MEKEKEFPFSRARRVTPAEHRSLRKAYKNTFGVYPPRRGRPPKKVDEKFQDVHIKIHPTALKRIKAEAKKKGVGYQTVINEILLKHAL